MSWTRFYFLTPALALCGALVHCRPTTPAVASVGMAPPVSPSGDQAGPMTAAQVDGVGAPTIPVCSAQGDELISIASLSTGVPSEAAMVRSAQGGAIAFVSENAAHEKVLRVAILRVDGHPDGEPRTVDGAVNASAPAMAVLPDGFALAWRDHTGSLTDERIVLMRLDPSGAPRAWTDIAGVTTITAARDPLHGKAMQWREATTMGLGPPVLASRENTLVLGFATQDTSSKLLTIEISASTATVRSSSGSPTFSLTQHPALGYFNNHWQWLAQDNAAPSSLWSARLGEAPALVTRQGSNASYVQSRAQLLYSYVTRSGTSSVVRLRNITEDAAPITTAVFSQSNLVDPVSVAMTRNLVGVVSLSHATDDATGSINISLANSQGEWIGRHASLSSMRLRSSQTIVAANPSLAGDAWVAFDARADDGNPVLGLTKIACNEAQEANAALLPTASMRQEPSPPEDAPVSSLQPASLQQCMPVTQATSILQHQTPNANITDGTRTMPVVRSNGETVIFATRRAQPQGPLEHVAPSVSLTQRVSNGAAVQATGTLLDASLIANNAVAITSDGWILRSTGGGTLTAIRSSLTSISSARFVRNGAAVVGYGRTENGSLALYLLGVRDGVPSAPVQISRATSEEIIIDDALRTGSTTQVLLARAVHRSDPTTRVRALLVVGDTTAARAALAQHDPMADPLAMGQHRAVLHGTSTALMMVWSDRETVRAAQIDHGMIRSPRSVFSAFQHGGEPLAMMHAANGELVITVTVGTPGTSDDMVESPYTAVVLRPDATARAVSLRTPAAGVGIPQYGRAFLVRNELTMLFAKPINDHTSEWLTLRTTCAAAARTTTAATTAATTATTTAPATPTTPPAATAATPPRPASATITPTRPGANR